MSNDKVATETKFRWSPLLLLFVGVLVVWALAWYLLVQSAHLPSWGERGTFGDMFGAVNALFSGLAFGGVIFAILMQRRELELQRHELELTKNELTRSADAQQQTASLLAEQVRLAALTATLTAEVELMRPFDHGTNGRNWGVRRVREIKAQISAALDESDRTKEEGETGKAPNPAAEPGGSAAG